jgi:hypothetical protein
MTKGVQLDFASGIGLGIAAMNAQCFRVEAAFCLGKRRPDPGLTAAGGRPHLEPDLS